MKAFVITLALAGLASAATVDAQILGNRLPTTNRGTSVDPSWHVVGRDGNGNIYERQTQDRYRNIVVQRARRNANGTMSIISTRTVSNTDNRNRRNCDYTRATNSISDRIFNLSNDVSCNDVGTHVDDGWYQVGRGRDNNSIYERRIWVNGRPVIQHGRLNSNGTFTILNSRPANDNDKQWQKDQKRQDKEWKKQQKHENKSNRGDDNENDSYRNRSYENDNSVYRGNDNSYQNKDVAKDKGHGKDNGKGKHKGKG